MTYIDAHNHLQDPVLTLHRRELLPALEELGVVRAVVNGTREADWEAVATLAEEHPWIQPSFGLHPWHTGQQSPDWLNTLRQLLEAHPNAGVGEIGLDRWIEGHDPVAQDAAFNAQLKVATELNRPATIHCLRAWGPLAETLRHPEHRPARGFLIHAYGGSLEMMHEFVQLGAYFSFNAYFLHERKAAQREVFARIPADRLLVETDAPSMHPPDALNQHPLRDTSGHIINAPQNIALAYESLAQIRGISLEDLTTQVSKNATRLFGE